MRHRIIRIIENTSLVRKKKYSQLSLSGQIIILAHKNDSRTHSIIFETISCVYISSRVYNSIFFSVVVRCTLQNERFGIYGNDSFRTFWKIRPIVFHAIEWRWLKHAIKSHYITHIMEGYRFYSLIEDFHWVALKSNTLYYFVSVKSFWLLFVWREVKNGSFSDFFGAAFDAGLTVCIDWSQMFQMFQTVCHVLWIVFIGIWYAFFGNDKCTF